MNFHLFSVFAPIPGLRAFVLWEGFVQITNDQYVTTEVCVKSQKITFDEFAELKHPESLLPWWV